MAYVYHGPNLGPTQPPIQYVTERDVDSSPFNAEVKKGGAIPLFRVVLRHELSWLA
jgi:hypothetical protein